MKKLNILYVDFSVGFGGSAISLKNLTNGISALGHHIVVAFTFHKKSSISERKLFPADVQIVSLSGIVTDIFLKVSRSLYDSKILVKTKITPFLMFFIKIFFDRLPTILKLYFLIKKEKIDVVHVNNGISIPIIMGADLAKVPCLVSLRSFVNKGIASRKILKKTDYFIANSQAVKRDFTVKSGINDEKVKVIYNGINIDEILAKVHNSTSQARILFGIKENQKIIGTVGRLIKWKRQDLLISAAEKLLHRGVDFKCLIIGDSQNDLESKNYENKLRNMVKERNLDKNVIFTGFIENPLEIMKGFDVFVLPSIIEPFGNVVLESMVLGVPVVAFNEGGPAEVITHQKDGVLVPVGDVDALTESIFQLLTEMDFHHLLAENAIRKVKNDFSLEKSVKQLDELYKEVAGK